MPNPERLVDDRHVVFDIHGGALLFGGGEENVRFSTAAIALRTGRVAYGIDYRVPPDGPFPAALDDCVAVYRALLVEAPADRIVISGTSAGATWPPPCCCALATRAYRCPRAHCC